MAEPEPIRPSVAAARPRLLAQAMVTRVGLVALSTDMTIEGDAWRLLPAASALHVARVRFDNPTTPENLADLQPRLAAAAELLVPGQPLAAIGFGCTAASSVIGDAVVARTIGAVRPDVPVKTPTQAACHALERLAVRRLALLTPYLPQTTEPMIGYFADHGFEVVRAHCLGFDDDRDMARIPRRAVIEAARAADHPQAEAVFLSCTALPAVPLLAEIESRLGKPVLSSNQVLFWAMMEAAGLPLPHGYGCLFEAVGGAA